MADNTSQINQMMFSLMSPTVSLLLIFVAIASIVIIYKRWVYMKSEYYAVTKRNFFTMRRDLGFLGEYLTYECLASLTGNRRFLFNCYIPKDDGTTSEIDIILLHTSGIYVLESKNYSGWIFGTETQKTWTQTLPNKQKNTFLNPLMQNSTHIKWLKRLLPEISDEAFCSIIVFSDRCELKKINLTTDKHRVIKRSNVYKVIFSNSGRQMLSDAMVDEIYQKLYPYTQASEEERKSHINAINSRRDSKAGDIKAITISPELTEALHEKSGGQSNIINIEHKSKVYCCKCGAEMVKRTASRGERKGKSFLGCSNYPRCKNTIDIDGQTY